MRLSRNRQFGVTGFESAGASAKPGAIANAD
jgi:hypothetical protein